MGAFEWYLLFALTTAICGIYELQMPVLTKLRITHPEHNMSENVTLSLITFGIIAFIIAPIILLSCLVPSFSERFRKAMYSSYIDT